MKKTAHYRRAIWLTDIPKILSEIIVSCLEEVDDDLLPVFDVGDNEQCILARRASHGDLQFLHFVTYETGAPTAVIKKIIAAGSDTVETEELDPNENEEFILAQLFVLVQGNNLVWTTHNNPLRENAIYNIFARFIESKSENHADSDFQMRAQVDEEAINRAFDNGISEIDLGLGAFRNTLEAITQEGELQDDGIWQQMRNIITNAPSAEQINASSDVEAKIVLTAGREWKKPDVKTLMAQLASGTRENHEGEFVIATKSGLRFTRDSLSVQKQYKAQGNKRILDSISVETQLRTVMTTLNEEGVLEA